MAEPHSTEPVIVRSGVSTLFLWMGPALLAVGIVLGVGGAIIGLATGDLSLVSMLVLTLIFGTGGVLMHLAGRRSRAQLDPEGITWSGVFGGSSTVPWRDVHHVEVPQNPAQGRVVSLVLRDGARAPVNAIRMSSGDGGAWADAGYRSAGTKVVEAHQAWLARTWR